MLSLKNISLFQFKNHLQFSLEATKKVVCISGLNGKGKTNVLDAIYYACFGKSYLAPKDSLVASKGLQGFYVQAKFELNSQPLDCKIIVRESGKKELYINQIEQSHAKSYLQGQICVFITPDDAVIITEGSEHRRKYMDAMLSIVEPQYLNHLLLYNKLLTLRNSVLKKWDYSNASEREMLDIYTEQLKPHLRYIQESREKYLPEIFKLIHQLYDNFSEHAEAVQLHYQNNLKLSELDHVILNNYSKDLALQRTNWGIHKDDIELLLNEMPFKQIASQGQRKTMLLAMKIAQLQFIHSKLNYYPILLLDDIYEKFDERRIEQLFSYIKHSDFQTFITDTHENRLRQQFGDFAQYIEL